MANTASTISLPMNTFKNILKSLYSIEDAVENFIPDNPRIQKALKISRADYEAGRVGTMADLYSALKPLK